MTEWTVANNELTELRTFLETVPKGPVSQGHCDQMVDCLARCWPLFAGGSEAGFEGYKLRGRVEKLRWWPPVLSFEIVRHGAAVIGGSTRGEVQTWQVDIKSLKVQHFQSSYRQLEKNDARWNHKAIVQKMVDCIVADAVDQFTPAGAISWAGSDEVTIVPSRVVPQLGPSPTVSGRRERFREELIAGMKDAGWDLTVLKGVKLVFQKQRSFG